MFLYTPQDEKDQGMTEHEMSLILFGHFAFQSVWAGIEIGLFDLLAKSPGSSIEAICDQLSLAPQPAEIIVNSLVAMKLLEEREGAFHNTPFAEKSLVRGAPNDLTDVMAFQQHIVYPALIDLADSLQQNRNVGVRHFPGNEPTVYARLGNDPKLESFFQNGMAAMHANRFLADSLDLGTTRHLVDMGGGAGRNAIALAKGYPNLEITIFDSATVCERATQKVEAAGLSDRVHVWPGSFFSDPFPSDIDGILFAHIGPIWSMDENQHLFRRALAALPQGGKLFLYNMVTSDDGFGPLMALFGSSYFQAIATGTGKVYPAAAYREGLLGVGFKEVTVTTAPVAHAVITATK